MFNPKRVIFEEGALTYDKGKELLEFFKTQDVEIKYSKSGRISGNPGKSPREMYGEGKKYLSCRSKKHIKI